MAGGDFDIWVFKDVAFRSQKIDSGTIGAILRERREHTGLRIKDISVRLQIQSAYLVALEEEKFDALPAPIYAKSFLKKYAEFLGLDTEELLAWLSEEFAVSEAIKTRGENSRRRLSWAPFSRISQFFGIMPSYPRWTVFAVVGVGLLSYFIYAFWAVFFAPTLIIEYPKEESIRTASTLVEIGGRVSRGADLTLNGKDVYVDKEGTFRATFETTSAEDETLEVVARNPFGKETRETLHIIKE